MDNVDLSDPYFPYDQSPAERLQRARRIAREEDDRLRTGSSAPPSAVVNTPMTSFLNLPNLSILNRIYIGSIQFDVSEEEVKAIFSVYGPVRSVNMMVDTLNKRHKGYGFVEFETPEAAQLAQAEMDGSQLAGRAIKVGRPSNFPVDLPPGVPKPYPTRIYVGNIHELIQEAELRAIFEAFGPLVHCNLVPDLLTRRHKGYGYVEFKETPPAMSAIQALNGFDLAGRPLKVGRTMVGGPIPLGMSNLSEIIADKPRVPTAVLRAAQQINATIVGGASTRILLGNLDDYEQVSADPVLLKELEVDILEECHKFGPVLECKGHLSPALREVQVQVCFADGLAAEQCIKVMDKRWFGGRQITAISLSETI